VKRGLHDDHLAIQRHAQVAVPRTNPHTCRSEGQEVAFLAKAPDQGAKRQADETQPSGAPGGVDAQFALVEAGAAPAEVIYLYDNPLVTRPLTFADVKHLLLGHWGTTPGQNFIYMRLNRVIVKYDLDMIYVSGPEHGGPAVVANRYLRARIARSIPHQPRRGGVAKALSTVTRPFDMTMLNDLDRFHLVMDAIDRLPHSGDRGLRLKGQLQDKLADLQAVHREGHAGDSELAMGRSLLPQRQRQPAMMRGASGRWENKVGRPAAP
jgi:hypothetical protein